MNNPEATPPPCPSWCLGDCVGGELEVLPGGLVVQTSRLHERTILRMSVGDREILSDTHDLHLWIEHANGPDHKPVTRVILGEVMHEDVISGWTLSVDQLRWLAGSLAYARELLTESAPPATAVA